MGTRFTRVTVIGDGRQIDISLPADTPLTEHLPTVLRLLSVPSSPVPVRWRLAAPEFGSLEPSRSLDDVGVLDGAQLYLTEASVAPLPPFVDDVEAAVAELVADRAPSWGGEARRSAIGWLLSVLLLAGLVAGLVSSAPVSWIAPTLVLVAALLAGGTIGERGGWSCGLLAVPAAVGLLIGVAAAGSSANSNPRPPTGLSNLPDVLGWNGFPLAATVVAAGALAVVGLVRRAPGVVVGGAAVAVVAGLALICSRAGLPADRTAALALVVAVVLAGLAGQLALGGAGLVDLMVADERGELVPRQAVVLAVRRGLALAAGLVWAAVITAAPACWVLVVRVPDPGTPSSWIAPSLGTLGGIIFGLRSRMFTRAAHVGPMLAVTVVTVAAIALRAPVWLAADRTAAGLIRVVILLMAGSLVVISGLGSLREVAGARLQRTLERLELLAILALVPGLVLLFRVIPLVQRWWS